jgi:peptidyl-tRNA hydrolase
MQKKVILTVSQQKQIDMLLNNAKWTRLVNGLLADKTINADTKAKMVYDLKKKIIPS